MSVNRKRNEVMCSTDGTFFEDMRAAERRILAEIDPEALKILDQEDAEMEQRYQEELARERGPRNGRASKRSRLRKKHRRFFFVAQNPNIRSQAN